MNDVQIPEDRLAVRPYLVTGGRTRAVVELEVETMVVAAAPSAGPGQDLGPEARRITELCRQPLSVAEVSAHTRLPLQVVKVLIGDLLESGLLESSVPLAASPDRPDLALLERVLSGLQSLDD